jgi:hypothetical protein
MLDQPHHHPHRTDQAQRIFQDRLIRIEQLERLLRDRGKLQPRSMISCLNRLAVQTITRCPFSLSAAPKMTYGCTSPREPKVLINIFIPFLYFSQNNYQWPIASF